MIYMDFTQHTHWCMMIQAVSQQQNTLETLYHPSHRSILSRNSAE